VTALAAAVDNLLAMMRVDPDLSTAQIFDGPLIVEPSLHHDAAITVGWLPDEGYAIEWTTEPESLAAGDDREDFTITGAISVVNGDVRKLPDIRRRAVALLTAIRSLVASDRTLRGAVSTATVNTVSAAPTQDADGAAFTIYFTVAITVF